MIIEFPLIGKYDEHDKVFSINDIPVPKEFEPVMEYLMNHIREGDYR